MLRWDVPLVIKRPNRPDAVIGSPDEALRFMDEDWPGEHGYLFGLARKRVVQSIDDDTVNHTAYLAFRAAISEIGIFPAKP